MYVPSGKPGEALPARPAQPGLYLISDKQNTISVANFSHLREVIIGRNEDASCKSWRVL